MPVINVRVNVNDKVRIKLTKQGKEIFDNFYISLSLKPEPYYKMYKLDSEDRITMELWNVMEMFGNHMYNGCRIPFETEIEFI